MEWTTLGLLAQAWLGETKTGLGFRTFPADSDPAWTEWWRGGGGWSAGLCWHRGQKVGLLLSAVATPGGRTGGGGHLRHLGHPGSPETSTTLGDRSQHGTKHGFFSFYTLASPSLF